MAAFAGHFPAGNLPALIGTTGILCQRGRELPSYHANFACRRTSVRSACDPARLRQPTNLAKVVHRGKIFRAN